MILKSLILIFISQILFTSCFDCTCTAMWCPDGLYFDFSNPSDSSDDASDMYKLKVILDDDTEIIALRTEAPLYDIEFRISHDDLNNNKPDSVYYQFFTSENNVLQQGKVALEWDTYKCNGCSGNGPNCSDQYVTTTRVHP